MGVPLVRIREVASATIHAPRETILRILAQPQLFEPAGMRARVATTGGDRVDLKGALGRADAEESFILKDSPEGGVRVVAQASLESRGMLDVVTARGQRSALRSAVQSDLAAVKRLAEAAAPAR